uniref:Eukaryotic peptide chain release factor subunit 1 n=1 Tax=Macrostomum lignano TaxID=282301 RepID=A0A1I8IRP6_9PLAT
QQQLVVVMATALAVNQPSAVSADFRSQELQQQQWKLKRLLRALDRVRGHNGTSLITLLVPPQHPLSRPAKLLAEEIGAAGNIKSRANRLAVLWALASVQQRLKVYSRVPDNGLVIFCGTIVTEAGKEKKVTIDLEPCKPVQSPIYLCDSRFHTEALQSMLETDERKFGFIVLDGCSGALFAVLSGSERRVLHRMSLGSERGCCTECRSSCPGNTAEGGQSAVRFARIRLEKRHNYLRKVAELASGLFLEPDSGRPAGRGRTCFSRVGLKVELQQGGLLDARLAGKVVDIAYGGEVGLNQAIELASDCLTGLAYLEEKRCLARLFEELGHGRQQLVCYGTVAALESGAVDTVLAWEELPYNCVLTASRQLKLIPRQACRSAAGGQHGDGVEVTDCGLDEPRPLIDWLADAGCPAAGAQLRVLACRSPEGVQFANGFGGLAGLLRYRWTG